MKRKRSNPEFLNGVPELLILSLLSRRPMYGYELVKEIRRSTEGALEFGEGCVYPVLHQLEADGMLSSKRQVVGGRSRVVYRVTAKGTEHFAGTETTWRRIAQAIDCALQGGANVDPSLA